MTPISAIFRLRGPEEILFGKTGAYAVAKLTLQGASFALILLATSRLSTADVGALGIVLALSAVVSMIAGTTLGAGLIKQAADYGEARDRHRYIRTLTLTGLALAFVLACVGLSLARPFATYVLGTEAYTVFVRWASVAIALQAVLALGQPALRAEGRDGLVCALMTIQGLLIVGATAPLLRFGGGLTSIAAVLVISSAVCAGAQVWVVLRLGTSPLWPAALRRALAFSLPLTLYVLATWVLNMGDRFLLAVTIDVTAAGVYTIAYTMGLAVELMVNSFNTVWAPYFFKHRADTGFQQTAHRILSSYFVLVAFAVLGVAVLAPTAAYWIAPKEWAQVSAIVPWIALAYGLNAFQYVWINVLYAHERTLYLTVSMCVAAAVFVVLTLLLLPSLRELAPAVATTMAFVTLAFLSYRGARPLEALSFDSALTKKVAALGVLCFAGFHIQAGPPATAGHLMRAAIALGLFCVGTAILIKWRDRTIVRLEPREGMGA